MDENKTFVLAQAQEKIKELLEEKTPEIQKEHGRKIARVVWHNAIEEATKVYNDGELAGTLNFCVKITDPDGRIVARKYATLEDILIVAKEEHIEIDDLDSVQARCERNISKIDFSMDSKGKTVFFGFS